MKKIILNFLDAIMLCALLLAASPALAQWQTPDHSVPIGRGAGSTGFKSAAPGTAGIPLVSAGAAADPLFSTIANSGFTPGAADTYKGSLNGTTVTDVAMPSCTATNQALRYGAGVGPNCATISVQTGYDAPINLGLSASASAGALTINVRQADGTAPSSTNPVLVPFRSTVATTGTVTWRTISSALSIVIPSGASLGTSSSNVPFRIWIFLDDNAGTPAIGVSTCSSATAIYPCASWESTLKTSTTISAGATSGGTLYATAGVSLDAVRIVGYCDFATGLATAGTYASSCTSLQVFGPGIKKPGDVVQAVYNQSGTQNSSTNTYTLSATSPTPSGGLSIVAQAIVPSASMNILNVNGQGLLTVSTAGSQTVFIYDTTNTTTKAVAAGNLTNNAIPITIPVTYRGVANSTSSITFTLYGTSSAGTVFVNGLTGPVQYFGTISNSFIRVEEIMGALEPANDNGEPLAMTG